MCPTNPGSVLCPRKDRNHGVAGPYYRVVQWVTQKMVTDLFKVEKDMLRPFRS